METNYTWKTKFFRNKYVIFQNEMPAGELKGSGLKRIATGELKGNKVQFEARGLFGHKFQIIDPGDNTVIGEITLKTWRRKASITLLNKSYNFQFDSFFHRKWSIGNENGYLIKYESGFKKGIIVSYTGDEVLILTGLYIRDFIRQRSAAIAAAAS